MAAAALLLLLLLLLPPLAALLRRGAGRWGALHLLHPQGALHLSRLARRRGPLLRMRLGGRDVLVLSSAGIIREALVRHCGDWLGRPPSYLGSLVSHGGQDLALGGPCPGWRQQRGAARGALARAGTQLGPLLWLQGQELCEELRSHGGAPLDPSEVFTFHTCSTIARLLFGDLVPPPGELRAFSCCLGELLQVWGRSTVRALDLLPPLRALPNPGLRELLRLVQHRDAFVEAQIRRHQLQARLRAELRGLQGPPGPGDTGRLPLLQATVSETLRLRPPAPLGLPHCALRHTSLGGLPIVAGTILVPNLLAAQQDPVIWQQPEAFLPERFLSPGAPWRSLLPFGCGARSCPGEALARAELFVFLGLILREFRLEPGPEGLPGLGVSPGTVLRCPPFHLRMVPCQPPGSP
ncbi:steroid 21-hydroxylase isoform X4 [Pseudopipra pipra]|uniref:steroid 21-hydroxylase isoform X4 n=1 Tax=Pseudopipra pipra TaxID=415032 RepID=UPI00313891CF